MRAPRSLGPLRHRGFRRLAAGQLASNVGDAFYAVALPWYVLADHGGALLLGTVLAAYGVPRTVLLAAGGHASDQWRPWTVMMLADTVRAGAVAGLAFVVVSGPARATLLAPIAALLGAGEGLFLPGSFSIIPSLLPGEDLQAGNALSSGGTQLATLVGPALGGLVVALVGDSVAFGVDAVSFAVSALSLVGARRTQRPPALSPPPSDDEAVAEPESVLDAGTAATDTTPRSGALTLRGLLVSEPVLLVILAVTVAANLGSGGMSEVALPALAHGPFHAGASGYGGLVAAFGGGALFGTIAAAQSRRSRRPAIIASLAFLAEAGFAAAVPYLPSVACWK